MLQRLLDTISRGGVVMIPILTPSFAALVLGFGVKTFALNIQRKR